MMGGETIDKNYVNYNNGICISEDKQKDPNREIIGVSTVEIYDERQQLVTEARSENIVMLDAIVEAFYYNFATKQGADANTFPISKFSQMVLTDSEDSEDQNLQGIRGNIIGFANTTKRITSTNLLQGTFEPTYSYYDPFTRSIRKSISYGPFQANGTFRTIWWMAGRELDGDDFINSSNGLAYSIRPVESIDISCIPTNYPISACHQGFLYCVDDETIYKCKLLVSGHKRTLVLLDTKAKHSTYAQKDLVFDPASKRHWSPIYGTSNVERYDYKMDYIDTVALPEELTYGYTDNFNKFAFLGINMYVIGADNTLYVYDYNGEELKTTIPNIVHPRLFQWLGVWSDGAYIYLCYMDATQKKFMEVFKPTDENGNLTQVCYNQVTIPIGGSVFAPRLWLTNLQGSDINGMFAASSGYLMKPFTTVGAQSKLSAPITKVQGQTMLIKYDFTFK